MGWLAKIDEYKNATRIQASTLEEILVELLNYGHPRVSHLKGGWYCHVEMNTNTVGSKFDVASEFNHPTPLSAANECRERIHTTLKALL